MQPFLWKYVRRGIVNLYPALSIAALPDRKIGPLGESLPEADSEAKTRRPMRLQADPDSDTHRRVEQATPYQRGYHQYAEGGVGERSGGERKELVGEYPEGVCTI